MQEQTARANRATQRYMAAWRWHFFAGIVVIPFLLVLATTGLVMLYYTAVQTPVGEQLSVHASAAPRSSPLQQLAAAQDALPGGTATVYIPHLAPTGRRSSISSRMTESTRSTSIRTPTACCAWWTRTARCMRSRTASTGHCCWARSATQWWKWWPAWPC